MTQPTTTELDLTEARALARKAWDEGHEAIAGQAMDASFVAKQAHIEAAARVIATALEARDAVITALVGAFTDPEAGEIDRRLAIKDARAILTKQEPKA